MTKDLSAGDTAPDFELAGEDGRTFRLGDFRGRKLVLYFYPKDDTPGCTKQAIGFTQQKDAFAEAETDILGVSKDTVEKHGKFRAKHDLDLYLGSDPEGEVIDLYGAWKEKKLYGRTFMGIERSTFLIDRDGKIARVWRKVRVKDHIDAVLAAARDLD